MRFINYINEIHNVNPNKGIRDSSDFIKEVKQNCSSALKEAKNGYIIYRGMLDKQTYSTANTYIFKKEDRIPRKSANTSNYYTLYMDNATEWKQFPKRSMSLICTTSGGNKARIYGNVFVVLPVNNSKIGICPLGDIWNSFDNQLDLLDRLIKHGSSIDDINSFHSFLKGCRISENKDKFLQQMKTQISYIPKKYGYDTLTIFKEKFGTWGNLLKFIYNPKEFKLTTIENYNIKSPFSSYGNELWIDDTCYLIKETLFNEYIKKGLL